MYIYRYISIYIYWKRTECSAFFCKRVKCSHVLLRSLQKNVAFFYVLCKRMYVLCILFHSFEKWNILLGFISHQKLKKRKEKNVAFFKRMEKNRTFRTEKYAVPNPDKILIYNNWIPVPKAFTNHFLTCKQIWSLKRKCIEFL